MKASNPIRKVLMAGVAVVSLAGLSACGTSQSDRALSGAGIGAGAGALGSAAFGGSPAAGALLGGAAGGAAGYFTDPNDVNLGRPLWRR